MGWLQLIAETYAQQDAALVSFSGRCAPRRPHGRPLCSASGM